MGGGGTKAGMTDIGPCAAMVLVEGCIIALTISAGTAIARGMNPFVFVVYSNGLASFILIPFSYLYHRDNRSEAPVLRLPFLLRTFLLGFIGVTVAQNLAFMGLSYSSPIVACGMANQIPAVSFVLGIIIRRRKLSWKKTSSIAGLVGTIVSIAGAVCMSLYRGPTITSHSPALRSSAPRLFVFTSTHDHWLLGCVLFAASSLTLSIWNIVQVGTVQICPQVMKIICFFSLFGSIQSAALALFLVRDPSAWRLDFNFELVIIVLTALFSSVIRSSVQLWCSRVKGPYFVPLFKPFGIPYACTFGSLFFSDTFHYGSMASAFICGAGYYTVLWGQIKEEDEEANRMEKREKIVYDSMDDDQKVPLLQDQDSQV